MNQTLAEAIERMKERGYSDEIILHTARYMKDHWEELVKKEDDIDVTTHREKTA